MNRTVKINTDSDISIPGLGEFAAGVHEFTADDDQIHVWVANNGCEWPATGLVYGEEIKKNNSKALPVGDKNTPPAEKE